MHEPTRSTPDFDIHVRATLTQASGGSIHNNPESAYFNSICI
jgi:hypothetical protein